MPLLEWLHLGAIQRLLVSGLSPPLSFDSNTGQYERQCCVVILWSLHYGSADEYYSRAACDYWRRRLLSQPDRNTRKVASDPDTAMYILHVLDRDQAGTVLYG